MRTFVFPLAAVALLTACDPSDPLQVEWEECVEKVNAIMPTTVTLAFRTHDSHYHDENLAGFTFKNGWKPISGPYRWTNGIASEGQNTGWFYQDDSSGSYERWMTYHNGGSLTTKDLITFNFQPILEPIGGSVAPNDGVAVDFKVVDVVYMELPSCQWQGG